MQCYESRMRVVYTSTHGMSWAVAKMIARDGSRLVPRCYS